MTEDRFDDFLKTALHELDPVPPTPREEMWARIEQQRRFTKQTRNTRTWLSWGVGLAAMLAVGVGLGRLSVRDAQQQTPVTAAAPTRVNTNTPGNTTAYKLVVEQYMTSAEALLTTFKTQPQGTLDPEIAVWARDLLTNTRLLLDSPAGDDPQLAALLEDLELIIAQIARLSAPSSVEKEIINDGMKKTEVLPRLRNAAGT